MDPKGTTPVSREEERFFLRAGWLVDGLGGLPRGAVIEVRGDRVEAVHEAGEAPDGPVLDFSGCTVIPGLVDAHLHLAMSGGSDPRLRERQLDPDWPMARGLIEQHLSACLAHGVVAVRDGGDRRGFALHYLASGLKTHGVMVQAAGRAWHAPERYGSLIGRSPGPGRSLAREIVADSGPRGVVKIVQSGLNSLVEYRRLTPPQFSYNELAPAVDAARACGLTVMAHANGEEPVRIAVDAGVASVEHGFFMGRENLARMADKGVVWVPTAVTMAAYAQVLAAQSPQAGMARRILDNQMEQLAWARDLGVRVATGTDAGSPGVFHGPAMAWEMALYMEAGWTLAEAVSAATREGARLLGLPNLGVLSPGKDATFLAAPGPPEDLLANLAHPRAVFVRGVEVSG
ncbi:MAG: amidohydrolase family protein [Pseudomonadota bacterium]